MTETVKKQKDLSAKLLERLTEEAIEQVHEIKARRIDPVNSPERKHRAREAIAVVGQCVNMHATLSRDRTNDIVEQRMLEAVPRALSAAK
jgi:hypothetical protein